MPGQRKTTEEQLRALREKQGAIAAKLSALETRKKAEQRKRETRRAFVVGTAALAHAEADPAFRDLLRGALQATVIRENDRAIVADLLGTSDPVTQGVPSGEPGPEPV
jgi:hypothetical protein